jgi:hypothetical protein
MQDWKMSQAIKSSRVNPIVAFLNKYSKLLTITDFEDHKPYYYNLYEKYRPLILNIGKNSSWLKDNVVLWYGEDIPKVRCKNYKIMLSVIYRNAELLRSAELNKLERDEVPDSDSYYYADEIIYYLLKIFKRCIEGSTFKKDIPELEGLIDDFAEDIGVEDDSYAKARANAKPPSMGGLQSMISNIFQSANAGDGKDAPNIDINELLDSVISDEKIKTQLQESISEVTKPDSEADPTVIMQKMLSSFAPMIQGLMNGNVPVPPGVTDNTVTEIADTEQDTGSTAQ